jgi:hypothetical protein
MRRIPVPQTDTATGTLRGYGRAAAPEHRTARRWARSARAGLVGFSSPGRKRARVLRAGELMSDTAPLAAAYNRPSIMPAGCKGLYGTPTG